MEKQKASLDTINVIESIKHRGVVEICSYPATDAGEASAKELFINLINNSENSLYLDVEVPKNTKKDIEKALHDKAWTAGNYSVCMMESWIRVDPWHEHQTYLKNIGIFVLINHETKEIRIKNAYNLLPKKALYEPWTENDRQERYIAPEKLPQKLQDMIMQSAKLWMGWDKLSKEQMAQHTLLCNELDNIIL